MVKRITVLVTRNGLGQPLPGDEGFGLDMFDKFVHTVEKREDKPASMCFYTEGVKLVCEGSPALLGLKLLAGMGVDLIVCATCLNYYGIADKLAVGRVGGMNDIVAELSAADSVITI